MTPFEHPIYVSRPSLPPLDRYAEGLVDIWASKWLTNGGPVLRRFGDLVGTTLQTSSVSLFSNGSLALQVALAGLKLQGEVITTPFSFVATANAVAQCGLTPVFADIESRYLTLDPDRVEAAITPRTCAILAVHVFGQPCALGPLQAIADRHGLALIYDAAHAFGTTVDGRSIAAFGDVTMFSFHATKLFHTIEGGALAFRNPALKQSFENLCNHGLTHDGDVPQAGLNAKMTEFQALMGELMLPTLPDAIAKGAAIEEQYRRDLAGLPGLRFLAGPAAGVSPNHCYMPVMIDGRRFGIAADRLREELSLMNVFARRYFHPLISDTTAFRSERKADPLSCARTAVEEILTLPSYADLPLNDVARICEMIHSLHRQPRACAGLEAAD